MRIKRPQLDNIALSDDNSEEYGAKKGQLQKGADPDFFYFHFSKTALRQLGKALLYC